MRELRKRGLTPTPTTDDGSDSGMLGTGTKTKEGKSEDDAGGRGSDPFGASAKLPPKWTNERDKSNQRERSMDLNSEGLDVSISLCFGLNAIDWVSDVEGSGCMADHKFSSFPQFVSEVHVDSFTNFNCISQFEG